MINMEYKPGAIAKVGICALNYPGEKTTNAIHSHHAPEKIMDLMQKGTFLELTEELASHEGCIAAFKNFKKSSEKRVKRDKYSSDFCARDDISKIQVLTQGISSDTKMMDVLKKRIEQLTSNMFEQQDKSPESSEKTKEK